MSSQEINWMMIFQMFGFDGSFQSFQRVEHHVLFLLWSVGVNHLEIALKGEYLYP